MFEISDRRTNFILWLLIGILVLFAIFSKPAHAQECKVPDQEIQLAFANAGITPAKATIPITIQKGMEDLEVAPPPDILFTPTPSTSTDSVLWRYGG